MGASKNWGPLFGSPYNKNPTILGSILGIVGNSHIRAMLGEFFGLWAPGMGPYFL